MKISAFFHRSKILSGARGGDFDAHLQGDPSRHRGDAVTQPLFKSDTLLSFFKEVFEASISLNVTP